jgi:hypothetical protein
VPEILLATIDNGGSGRPSWIQHLSKEVPKEVLEKENLNKPLNVKGSGIVQAAVSEERVTALSIMRFSVGEVVVKRICAQYKAPES